MTRQTFGFSFSLLLTFFILSDTQCQDKRTYGLRAGIDLAQFPYYFLEPEIRGIELSADAEMFPNIYPVIEAGISKTIIHKENYNYHSDGSFFRIGFDYNFLEPYVRTQYDMGFIGIRYGYSTMSFAGADIQLPNTYWGNFILDLPEQNVKTHWIEFTGGVRAEIFRNVFLGWSVRARLLLSKSDTEVMKPYNIPGFGKGIKSSVVGLNYSIFYRIPMVKKKIS